MKIFKRKSQKSSAVAQNNVFVLTALNVQMISTNDCIMLTVFNPEFFLYIFIYEDLFKTPILSESPLTVNAVFNGPNELKFCV